MNKKSFSNSAKAFFLELIEEFSIYFGIFLGIFVGALFRSIIIGLIAAASFSAILTLVSNKLLKVNEVDNSRTYPTWILLLIVAIVISAGSLVAYYVVN